MIGVLGGIRFRASDNQVLIFKSLKHEISSAWNTMERIGQKPLSEFGGAKLQTVSMDIRLDASLGIKPRKLLLQIESMVESGQAHSLIIGKRLVGKNKWVIVKSSEAWDTVLTGGELLLATVSLTLQEYI